jgi:hypothetical protein
MNWSKIWQCIYVSKSQLYSWQMATFKCVCIASTIDGLIHMEHWWNDSDRGKLNCSENICASATFSTTNPIMRGLALNSRPPRWEAGDTRLISVYYQNLRLKKKCSDFIYCFMNGKWAGLWLRWSPEMHTEFLGGDILRKQCLGTFNNTNTQYLKRNI